MVVNFGFDLGLHSNMSLEIGYKQAEKRKQKTEDRKTYSIVYRVAPTTKKLWLYSNALFLWVSSIKTVFLALFAAEL